MKYEKKWLLSEKKVILTREVVTYELISFLIPSRVYQLPLNLLIP